MKFQEGDVIRFGWNHVFGEPSCVIEIQSMIENCDGELVVPVPFRVGPEKTVAERMKLKDLVDEIEYYMPEVIPMQKVDGEVQIPMYF